ncbi:fibrous sheath CABYR-binding protein [Drosophila bipectinata]|uniref:fibrous sheath CABYR-binding protein n=1 Tax=Drosophila bipectinata TaxID=42026 RepID=UPI001C8AE597|nr:titin [Drosophila bipectinata]
MTKMWRTVCVVLFLTATCQAGPLSSGHQKRKHPAIRDEPTTPAEVEMPEQTESEVESSAPAESASLGTLTLPSNATSIRADITDNFSCANKSYGYYADVENDCQIFHVCLPVTYADGRENTFRWSFICPEDTIFSQESFTCMRREDMTIECSDSSRYYELNGNFGGAVEEEKPTPAESEQPEKEETEEAEPEEPAPAPVEPAKPVKPVKTQKPKPQRRKPQRKVAVTAAPEVESQPEPVAPVEVEPKPVKPQRFTVRPNKDNKPKPAIAAPPMRNELFNGIRKRPAIFNKPTTTPKPVEEVVDSEPVAVTEAVVQLSEPQPTLKLQTMFAEPVVIPVEVQEPEVQASEPAVSFVQPEVVPEELAPTKIEIDTKIDDIKPIEAIEEIPAVIVESLDQQTPLETEKEPMGEQEEIKPEEGPKQEEEIKPEEEVKQEEEIKPEEETKPEEDIKPEEPEVPAKVEEISVPVAQETPANPAIVETSNSNEESNIESLEAAKPADAPESMPATPGMEEHSPLVEQVLDLDKIPEGGETQESLGGFKPVDPAMAAEAEQLITDFLNTLRKNEEKPETDMAEKVQPVDANAEDVSIEEAKLPEPEIVDKNASIEEQILEESETQKSDKPVMMKDSPIINIMQLNHLPMDYQIPVQVIPVEAQPAPEQPEVSGQSEEAEKIAAEEATPEDVKETAAEEIKEEVVESSPEVAEESAAEDVKEPIPEESNNEDDQSHVDAQDNLVTAAYMPSISIDDIVELVKERLDQTPKKEQMAPMELILTPGAAAPLTLVQANTAQENQATSEAETLPEEEKPILPIYSRITAAEPAMSKVQTLPVTAAKVETDETESQPEVREPKAKAKMDARKRRFLFRADAS